MVSTVPNAAHGALNSQRVRGAKSRIFLEAVYAHVRDLARAGKLATTNKAIAQQLNALNVRTARENLLGPQQVHHALNQIGVDRRAIRRWRASAERAAEDFQVPSRFTLHQLWQEWLWHEKVSTFELGLSIKERDQRPFIPKFFHPNEWVPPWVREPQDSFLNKLHRHDPSILPQSARLVEALIGHLDPDEEGAF